MAKCIHSWRKLDKDDSFKKKGRFEVKRVKVKCMKCGKEKVREVKRRLK